MLQKTKLCLPSLFSNIVNLKVNLLNQSRLNFATFCCIELCFLMRTVSCNPVVCITLRKCCYVMWWFKTIWCFFLHYMGQALIWVLFLQVLNYSFRYGASTAVVQSSWVTGNHCTWRRDLHLMCPAPLFATKAKHKDFCSYSSSSRKQTFGCGVPKTTEAKHLKYESFARQYQLVYTIS